MKTHKKAAGFTLIELMFVLAVVAILVALAVPAYNDYTIRAKVAEGLFMTAPAKVAVSEYFSATGELPPGGDHEAAGFAPNSRSTYVESVDWHEDQRIEIEFDEAALGLSTQLELGLDPEIVDGVLLWRCVQDENVSNDNLRYLPASCRDRI
ncbi:MAG: pilin [Pseudomonadota bacterium]